MIKTLNAVNASSVTTLTERLTEPTQAPDSGYDGGPTTVL
jgi:hypothetical protein